jgi:hypothetical protein
MAGTKYAMKGACVIGALAVAALTFLASAGDVAPSGRSTIGGDKPLENELDKATQERVRKGLDWLARNIDAGSVGARTGRFEESIAVQALAGIAFLANGDTPEQGPYARQVQKILDYVLENEKESGLLARDNDGTPMYGHGFAMLFLAEVYGMSPKPELKERLQQAIRLTVQTQNREGGWQYQPRPETADTSATICQVMALRAARNAGIAIPQQTVDAAIKYTLQCQNPDGGFRYMMNQGTAQSGWARSSASTVALKYLGAGEGKPLESARSYLLTCLPGPAQADNGDPGAVAGVMYFYGNYYMCQAMFMLGGDAWARYWPLIRDDMGKRQQADGSWTGEVNSLYSTSLALIVLQVPNRLLPVLQK